MENVINLQCPFVIHYDVRIDKKTEIAVIGWHMTLQLADVINVR